MRFLQEYIFGEADFDLNGSLRTAGVPFTPLEDACKYCETPCDDLGEYPSLRIDNTSNMLGRVKPYSRQVTFHSLVSKAIILTTVGDCIDWTNELGKRSDIRNASVFPR